MEKIQLYLKESFEELRTNVTWPTWKDLQIHAAVVAVASIIIAFVIFAMDIGSKFLLTDFIYKFLNS